MHTMWVNDSTKGTYAVGFLMLRHYPHTSASEHEFVEIAQVNCEYKEDNPRLACNLVNFLNGGDSAASISQSIEKGWIKWV